MTVSRIMLYATPCGLHSNCRVLSVLKDRIAGSSMQIRSADVQLNSAFRIAIRSISERVAHRPEWASDTSCKFTWRALQASSLIRRDDRNARDVCMGLPGKVCKKQVLPPEVRSPWGRRSNRCARSANERIRWRFPNLTLELRTAFAELLASKDQDVLKEMLSLVYDAAIKAQFDDHIGANLLPLSITNARALVPGSPQNGSSSCNSRSK